MQIRLAGVEKESIVDGPGFRYTVFVQGCPHACPGCHNPHTHDFNAGYVADTDELFTDILRNPLLRGVTFSGGEPFCQSVPLHDLGQKLKASGYDIVTYTGYTLEELLEKSVEEEGIMPLLMVTDVLIDGRFLLAEKNILLRFRGSANQRLLDCPASLREGRPVPFAV